MPYISLDNLTQYNGRLRDYIDSSFDKLDGANWRKTSAAQSVSCWPIPESPLEPEVTFKFSEVPPESGDKGPDNPSTIVGVESVSCNVCESEGVYDTPFSIDLGGTYYGGTVNFATGVMEVTHRYFEVDPDVVSISCSLSYEATNTSACYFYPSPQRAAPRACAWSNRFITDDTIGSLMTDVEMVYTGSGATSILLRISKTRLGSSYDATDVAAIKSAWAAWLRANSTYIAYQLVTPITIPLTPVLVRSLPALSHYTPRQNTIYTPHESVQVGYAKSASKTSQDLANAIVALGGNV